MISPIARPRFLAVFFVALLSAQDGVVGQCNLCFDGSSPPDLELAPAQLGEGAATCGQLLEIAGTPVADVTDADFATDEQIPTCDDWLLVGSLCGCPIPQGGGGCSLCADGTAPPDPSLVSSEDGLTCGDLAEFASLATAEQCGNFILEGLSCGCAPPVDGCKLCEDESEIPTPDLFIGELSCSELETFATLSGAEECSSWQATIGTYCGCVNPTASEGFCRICGDNTLLLDPTRVAYSEEDDQGVTVFAITCAELELNESGLYACEDLRSEWSDQCCSVESPIDNNEVEVPPTELAQAPTQTPVEAPPTEPFESVPTEFVDSPPTESTQAPARTPVEAQATESPTDNNETVESLPTEPSQAPARTPVEAPTTSGAASKGACLLFYFATAVLSAGVVDAAGDVILGL
jgi:hypothetical protein